MNEGARDVDALQAPEPEVLVTQSVRPLPWASRLSSMPYLPGGGSNQVILLRELLQAVDARDGLLTATVTDGGERDRSLRDALKPLASTGFVQPMDRDHVVITEEARPWLQSNDDASLLAIFHRHVRYVGELLDALKDGPLSVRDLVAVAADQYDLTWSTPDQARRRVTWLACLGAVEYRTNTLLAITEHGRELLAALVLDGPAKSAPLLLQPIEFQDPPPVIGELLAGLTPASLAARNQVLGYIPRGKGESDVVQALQALVNAASPSTTKSDLLAFAEEHFGVSESSFGAVLTTLTRSGCLEQTALNTYQPTAAAAAWLETADALDLALMMHARYMFVLEIIPTLQEFDRVPDLARAAVDYYGLGRADAGGIRTRLQILKAAGLVVERGNWRYQATPLGEEVAARFPLQDALDEVVSAGRQEAGEGNDHDLPVATLLAHQIGFDLVAAGTDSDNPIRLEQVTARALQFLGFEARHIGGGGNTDVLATVDSEDSKPIRVIVDAKSARSGSVSEGAVSFDTLGEHKNQNRADHVVLVGPSFGAGRVRARAKQNLVTLITTTELAEIVNHHARTPLSAYHYLVLIQRGEDGRRELDARWAAAERRMSLLSQVITVLADEARDADEVTHGALTSDQIYLIARVGDAGPRPQLTDIEGVLGLLRHPLIDAIRVVQADRGRPTTYYLIDAPSLVREKLTALARALDGIDDVSVSLS